MGAMNTVVQQVSFAAAIGLLGAGFSGCQSGAIAANNQVLQEQQAQIERMQRQIDSLQARERAGYAPGVAASGVGCDRGVQAIATQRGGDRFAAGDFARALGYYQDALAACPGDGQAELNVARTYEAVGDKQRAVEHYRVAANPSTGVIGPAQEQARDALQRLQASQLP